MLTALGERGEDAGADFNDGLDGWFGWSVDLSGPVPVVSVSFEKAADGERPTHSARWELRRVT